MKLSLLLASVLACAAAFEPISLYYHENIGIKEAARIKAAEEAADFDGARIGGGSLAGLGLAPYMVGLLVQLDIGTSVCGASLVSNNRLVTAAHCWWDGRNQGRSMVAVLGSVTLFSGGTRVTATNVQMQGNFNPSNLNHDIAVVHIPWVSYNNVINRIVIPTGATTILSFAGDWARAVGFGVTNDSENLSSNQVLRQINLQVISNIACAQSYGFNVIDTTLCTSGQGNVGICGGDSGGPLSLTIGGQRTLIGVISFHHNASCRNGFPSGYARVTSYSAWIQARL